MKKIIRISFYISTFFAYFFTDLSYAAPASSADIRPPSVTSMHQEVQLPTPILPTDSQPYINLKLCPTSPVCPDLNGKIPAGKTLDCPSSCVVLRKANIMSVNPIRYATVTHAVCPNSYTSSHVFNVGPEIQWDPNPPMVKPPITSAQWSTFKSAGFTCSLSSDHKYQRICDNDPWYPTPTPYKETESGNTVTWQNNDSTKYILNFAGLPDTLVQIVQKNKWTSCKSPLDLCGSSETPACQTIEHNWNSSYVAAKIQCKPPAGFYETSLQVPTGLICTHVQSVWQ